MLTATVGQVMVNRSLPPELRDYTRRLDKKSVQSLMTSLYDLDKSKYRQVSRDLQQVGGDAAQSEGNSFSLADFLPPQESRNERESLRQTVMPLLESGDPGDERKAMKLLGDSQKTLQSDLYNRLLERGNPFGVQAASGSRGNPSQIRSLMLGDLMAMDHRDREIPIPILHSYAEGLDPVEYWAGAYGARRGVIGTKFCLAAGTDVLMADRSVKRIEEVVIGDHVLTVDEQGQVVITTVTGISRNGLRECSYYGFFADEGGRSAYLTATPEHQAYATYQTEGKVTRSMVAVGSPPSYQLQAIIPPGVFCTPSEVLLRLMAAAPVGELETLDLEVEHPSHRFVLANGLTVSNSTRDAGAFSKQVAQAAHQVIAVDDDPLPGTGLVVDTDDPQIEGYALAQDYSPFKRGHVIDGRTLSVLKRKHPKVVVHSAVSDLGPRGGVPRISFGMRERGGLPPAGENVGLLAAQALGEKITQLQLSSKHGGGQKTSGFELINNLVQVPRSFPGGAAVADLDGRVESIEDAPQGGKYVVVGGQPHYVEPSGEVVVKQGDKVEAGDSLSTGLANPALVVKHRGIGEGRKALSEMLVQAYRDSGLPIHRRNAEALARGLINTVRVTELDAVEGALPDDLVDYDELAARWTPREGAAEVEPSSATGKYMERPALHYSLGTRVTPRIATNLHDAGVNNILVHEQPPPWEPEMGRAMESLSHNRDWLVRFGGSYQQRGLLEAVHRGRKSETPSKSFVPAMVMGQL